MKMISRIIRILIATAPVHLMIGIACYRAFGIGSWLIWVNVLAWLVLADAFTIFWSRGARRMVEDIIVAEWLVSFTYLGLTLLVPRNTSQEEKQALYSVVESDQATNEPLATKQDINQLRDEITHILSPPRSKPSPRRR